MRDGTSPEVIAILDTIPELEIVKELVATPPYPTDSISYCRHEYETSIVGRFLTQTRIGGDGNPFFARDVGKGWQEDPQFEVREEDIYPIVCTAKEILEQGSLIGCISKSARARKAAAKNVVAVFGND